jgi:hypothetical protein
MRNGNQKTTLRWLFTQLYLSEFYSGHGAFSNFKYSASCWNFAFVPSLRAAVESPLAK